MTFTKSELKQTGLFAGLYFLCMGLGVFVNFFIDKSGAMFYAPALTAVFGAAIYLHFAGKIQRFGAISLVGTLMGSFFLFTGHMAWAFLPGLVCGLLADLVARQGQYVQTGLNKLSFLLFAFVPTGPIFFMWIDRAGYAAALAARGKSSEYINRVLLPADLGTMSWFIFTLLLGSILGLAIASLLEKGRAQA